MADELTIAFRASFAKGGTLEKFPNDDGSAAEFSVTVSGSRIQRFRQRISVGGTEILVAAVGGAGGWLFGVNRDATNFMSIRESFGATNLIKLKPGEPCMFRISPSATAVHAFADTANVEFDFLLIEA